MGDGLLLSGVVSCFCEEEANKQAGKHSSPFLAAFFAFLVVVFVEQSELLLL
jgi:hypothetical protein